MSDRPVFCPKYIGEQFAILTQRDLVHDKVDITLVHSPSDATAVEDAIIEFAAMIKAGRDAKYQLRD